MSSKIRTKSAETKIGRVSAIACLAVLLWMFPVAAQAQMLYGSLTGNVTDPSGASVPAARVQALNVKTGVLREVTTKEGGTYQFTELLPGVYKISVTLKGFAVASVENVQV